MSKSAGIIMPVYNSEAFLQESLGSIAAQTYNDWHLTIVDDGSADQSMKICRDFMQAYSGKCTILSSLKKQSGAGACRNLGWRSSEAPYIIFLDSDDTLEPFCLAQRVKAMEEHAYGWAVFKQYIRTPDSKHGPALFTDAANNREDAIAAFMRLDPPWQTMAPIWRKDTLKALNGFDESLVYMEDPDLHLRALLNTDINPGFEYDLPPDNYYRVNNISNKSTEVFYDNSIRSRIYFLEKYAGIINNDGVPLHHQYSSYLKTGFYRFLKTFLLARICRYKKETEQLADLFLKKQLISQTERNRLRMIFKIFLSESALVKALRLKGIVYRFIK